MKGSVQEPHICNNAVIAPFTIFTLSKTILRYWQHQNTIFLIFKHAKLSNTTFPCLGGFKFSFSNRQIRLKCLSVIFWMVSFTLKYAQIQHM